MIVGDPHRPATERRGPGDRDVTTQRDEDAGARPLCRGERGAVSGERLRRRTQIELHTGRDPDRSAILVQLDESPAGSRRESHCAAPVSPADDRERPVVAGESEPAADGRVDQPAGCRGSSQRDAHGLEEITPGLELFALGSIQPRQLGVVTEPAARAIDSLELAHELRRASASAASSVVQSNAAEPSAARAAHAAAI